MIGRLTGIVVDEDADGNVVIDVGGVGYELTVPLGTFGRVRGQSASADGAVTVVVHTHVREDAFVLYGFATSLDRTVFRALLGISSVGPRTALAIMSMLSVQELSRAVAEKNTSAFTAVSGVGKKTAERLLLELKDKLPLIQPNVPGQSPSRLHHGIDVTEVVGALAGLGFKPAEAERAVGILAGKPGIESPSQLLREAIGLLRR